MLDVVQAGCSLKLMLDWAWDRVVEIKNQLDQLCKFAHSHSLLLEHDIFVELMVQLHLLSFENEMLELPGGSVNVLNVRNHNSTSALLYHYITAWLTSNKTRWMF